MKNLLILVTDAQKSPEQNRIRLMVQSYNDCQDFGQCGFPDEKLSFEDITKHESNNAWVLYENNMLLLFSSLSSPNKSLNTAMKHPITQQQQMREQFLIIFKISFEFTELGQQR